MWTNQHHGRRTAPFGGTRRHTVKAYGADRIGLVGFNDRGFVIAKPAEAHAAWLQERVRQLHQRVSGSYTNIADGLRKSLDLLRQSPPSRLRRLWLLSDGEANFEVSAIMPTVEQLRRERVNINCIGFGDAYDAALLSRISAATHNGKVIPVRTLRGLTDALLLGTGGRGASHYRGRAETTVLCLDLSPSMTGAMDDRRKVEVVEEAVLALLLYKQRNFS
jgi:uncharacterized protein with von Willebrand factor type A (vWA) domain